MLNIESVYVITYTFTCSTLIRACKQSVTNEWKVTKANYGHQNCAGGTKKPSIRALLPEATAIVKNNSTITTPALGKR